VGVWQINVLIPKTTAVGKDSGIPGLTGSQASLALIVNYIPSYDYTQYRTVIYVQP
jgi:hypothetical protein